MTESCLEKLKKDYRKFEKKYNLPSFEKLNEDFEVEKATERETDFPLREIRKYIMDKVVAYLRFVELLLNPSSGPMFFMMLVKGLNGEDKKILERMYNVLGKFETEVIELDIEYDENLEAEFIKKTHNKWQEVKRDMWDISNALKRSWDAKVEKKEKGYLG